MTLAEIGVGSEYRPRGHPVGTEADDSPSLPAVGQIKGAGGANVGCRNSVGVLPPIDERRGTVVAFPASGRRAELLHDAGLRVPHELSGNRFLTALNHVRQFPAGRADRFPSPYRPHSHDEEQPDHEGHSEKNSYRSSPNAHDSPSAPLKQCTDDDRTSVTLQPGAGDEIGLAILVHQRRAGIARRVVFRDHLCPAGGRGQSRSCCRSSSPAGRGSESR